VSRPAGLFKLFLYFSSLLLLLLLLVSASGTGKMKLLKNSQFMKLFAVKYFNLSSNWFTGKI